MRDEERTSEIYRGSGHVLLRVHGAQRAVRKQLSAEVADPRRLQARLRHEHDLLSSLNLPGVVRARGWTDTAGGPVLWLEDAGPSTLTQWLEGKALAVPVFLPLAIQLAEALARLHARGIIHRDLSPGNVVVDGGRLTLIDFETAAVVSPGGEEVSADAELELLYAAPEQTGRMNRRVDRRADLYSLGAIFYEMLSGAPPFPIGDPIELVHAHLARTPRPLPDAGVPRVLSDLVLRLLAKAPERRYQSADGLLADLREAAARLQPDGSIASFPLGQADLGPDFLSGGRLYGRGAELHQLRATWERSRAGSREMVLVTGEAGTGKSELLRAMQAVVTGAGGRFGAGKADLRQSNTPYAPIVDALRALVRELTEAPSAQIAVARPRIAEALRAAPGLLTDLIPELEWFVGPSPPPPALGPREAEGRFLMVFSAFVGALASEDHPLALFIDDLQWADSASTTLIRRLAATADIRHFLLLLASRVEAAGTADLDPEALGAVGTGFAVLPLVPLPVSDLTALCRDLLGCDEERARPLAELLAARSGGNPLFFRRLLRHLHQDELLVRDAGGAWTWDLARIATVGVTDNVAELMAEGLRRLSPAARALLGAGACVGRSFNLGLVAEVRELPLAEAAAALGEAATAGQVQALAGGAAGPRPEDRFQFAHDRVQQAAYATLTEAERLALHLRIGRSLAGRDGQPIFEVVDQLNLGADLIGDPAERLRVAGLGFEAERRARAASAFGPALEYLKRAIQLLPADAWRSEYQLVFDLHRDAVECAFWTGEGTLAAGLFQTALDHAASRVDRAELYRTRVASAFGAADFPGAVRWGREGLALFGIALPDADDRAAADAELARVEQRLAESSLDDLLKAEPLREPELLARLQLLAPLQTAAYYVSPSLWMFTVCRMVNLTLEHGPAQASSEAFVSLGSLMLLVRDDPGRGCALGRFGLALARKLGDIASECRATAVFVAVLACWRDPIDVCLPPLFRLHDAALGVGELTYAFANMITVGIMLHHRGAELTRVLAHVDVTLKLAIPGLSTLEQQRMVGLREAIHRLQGIAAADQPTPDGTVELATAYLLRDLAQARALIPERAPLTRSAHMVDRCFYGALTLAGLYPNAAEEQRAELLASVAAGQERLAAWAGGCPENFCAKANLVAAERARIEGRTLEAADLYDQAAGQAAAGGFSSDEGLANELAARFHRGQGRAHFARLYASRAVAAYARWGARAKVEALEDEFPAVAEEKALAPRAAASLDLVALLRAAEAISGEVVFERLCFKLIEVCLATAGAERAVLVLVEEAGPVVRALGSVQAGAESLREPLVGSKRIPGTLVHQALRTGEPLVVADASRHPELRADEYVAAHGVRSALALPIVHQGRPVGALYLENNLASRVFVPERVRLLQLLSSQIATSLQNSQLFQRLTEEVEERKRAEAEIARLYREAQETIRIRDEFLSVASHELKTPLSSLRLLVDDFQENPPGPSREVGGRAAAIISRQVQRLEALVEDLLDVVGIRSGRLVVQNETVDLAALVRDLAERFAPQLAAARCQLAIEAPPALWVTGDRARLDQVLNNLLANAAKFGAGRPIEIRAGAEAGLARLTIIDHGIGIPADRLPHIFGRFERAASYDYGGLGLGLYIARQLMSAMGGRLSVESAEGVGSRFTVELPVAAPPTA
jgi:predicted ATPase/signal transduction histidine kinase